MFLLIYTFVTWTEPLLPGCGIYQEGPATQAALPMDCLIEYFHVFVLDMMQKNGFAVLTWDLLPKHLFYVLD